MRRIVFTLFVLLTGLSRPATADDQDLSARLTGQYRDRILALRHAFTARSQEYDSQGNSLSDGEEGAWSVFGRIEVTKVSITADHMRVEGDQVVFASQQGGGPLKPSRQPEHVKINIRLDHGLVSEEEAIAILSRVFALTPQDVVDSAPSLWQDYLAKELKVQPSAKLAARKAADQGKPTDDRKDEMVTHDAGRQKVFKLGKDVIPPKPITTPEPEFSQFARKQKFGGTLTLDVVVDSSGNVAKVTVMHPLGMGLDEAAAAKVSSWRFTPAMYDGRPVAVAVNIEVSFQLYDRR